MSGKPWDITSPRSFEAFAEWIRGKADASVVLVIRGDGCTVAVAEGITPRQAQEAVEFALPGAVDTLAFRRNEAREKAERKKAAAIAGKVGAVDSRRPW